MSEALTKLCSEGTGVVYLTLNGRVTPETQSNCIGCKPFIRTRVHDSKQDPLCTEFNLVSIQTCQSFRKLWYTLFREGPWRQDLSLQSAKHSSRKPVTHWLKLTAALRMCGHCTHGWSESWECWENNLHFPPTPHPSANRWPSPSSECGLNLILFDEERRGFVTSIRHSRGGPQVKLSCVF